jgi:hypothetical protein
LNSTAHSAQISPTFKEIRKTLDNIKERKFPDSAVKDSVSSYRDFEKIHRKKIQAKTQSSLNQLSKKNYLMQYNKGKVGNKF